MIQVRKSVFETNSSSTHSLTMCNKSEYDAWNNGELYYCEYGRKGKYFMTPEEVVELVKLKRPQFNVNSVEDLSNLDKYDLQDIDIYTAEEFWDYYGEEYETFESEYNGVVAFGYHGCDY